MTTPADDVARLEVAPESAARLDAGLGELPGANQLGEVAEQRTTTVYYDTPDLRLTRDGAVLRRSDGWALRLPGLQRFAPDDRGSAPSGGLIVGGEVVEPAGGDGEPPPPRLATLARAWVRGAPLVPVATVRGRARVRQLSGGEDAPVVELRDEELEAEGPFGTVRRRQLTVSGPDDADLRARVAERLGELGANPATPAADPETPESAPSTSSVGSAGAIAEVALALGPAAELEPDVPHPPPRVDLDRPAGELVTADLRAHVRALLEWEAPVQLDLPDAVHKMRVAVRRLRSSLRTFAPLLDGATVRRLEPELRWLAASLGGARDAEVMRGRLAELARTVPAGLQRGGAEEALTRTLDERYDRARAELLADLDTPRYRQLLVDVVALAARPPLLATARPPVAEVVPPLLHKAWRKLRRRVERARSAQGDEVDEVDEGLHRARKSAKQLRYAAEACSRAYGRPAERLAAQAEAAQEVLGEHQDSVVSQELLVRLADDAHRQGRDTFTYGVLVGEERRRAERSRDRFGPVWKETSRRRHRRWLRR